MRSFAIEEPGSPVPALFATLHQGSGQWEKYICNGNNQISSENKILLKKMFNITRQSALEKFSGRSLQLSVGLGVDFGWQSVFMGAIKAEAR